MKKILFVLVGAVVMMNGVFAVDFSTVLDWMYENGLTRYQTEAEFRGDDNITRGEASKFVNEYAMLLWLEKNYDQCEFSDIAGYDSTLLPHIAEACAFGLLKGSNGAFMPENNISEAEAITVVVRTLQWFQDETGTPWYKNYYDMWKEMWMITTETLDGVATTMITRAKLGTWFYMAAKSQMNEWTADEQVAEEDSMDTNQEEDDTMDDSTEQEEDATISATYELYSQEAFDAAVDAGKRVVLNFRASRCPTCKATSENIMANLDTIPGDVVILETDYDTYTELKQEYGVTQQTTFVFFDNQGTYLETVTNIRSAADVLEELS